jgi:nucleotidyltransferase/DNA polymerase involved in DNA repair
MAIVAMLLVVAAVVGGTVINSVAAATSPRTTAPDGGVPPAAGSPDPATTNTAGTWAAQACAEFRAAFAKELGVDPSALTPAAKSAARTVVDSAVAAGRITKARGDKLKEKIDQADANGCGLLGRQVARIAGTLGVLRDGVKAAADALKLTPAELTAKLRAGATLQQVASDAGVPYDAVTTAVLGAVKADLDKAVAAGAIRQQREDRILERLSKNLAEGRFRDPKAAGPDQPAALPTPSSPGSQGS